MKDAYVLKCSKVKLSIWIVVGLFVSSLFGAILIAWIEQDKTFDEKDLFIIVLCFVSVVLGFCTPIPFLKETKWMKRRIVIDREGIKTSDFTVAWSEVKECFYWKRDKRLYQRKERVLVIMTTDGGEYDESLDVYSYDKQELREMINLYAGCIKYNEEVSSLEETKARLTNFLDWSSAILLAVAFLIFTYRCIDESLPLAENIFWWCVVGVLAAVATVGHHYYLKHWQRKNNYYHD